MRPSTPLVHAHRGRCVRAIGTATLALAPLASAPLALAQEYPAKAVRLLVPFPPGGVGDTVARVVAQPLSRALGQQIVVENRTGANTVIATELLLRAPADGHTFNIVATSFTVNPSAYTKLPYDSLKDFVGITRLVSNPLIICVHPSLPVKSVKDLVALARVRPDELTWGVSSALGGGRIAGELFSDVAKIKMINVAYGGGAPATTAVLGGHTSMLIGNVLDCAPYIESGRMRPVAVTSLRRSDTLKSVPTLAESGYPGFDATNWFGTIARVGTPKAALDRLHTELVRALQLPEVTDVLAKLGLTPATMSPAEFDAFIRVEMEKTGKIVRALGLKAE
ncbi:MAG: tripartite tricarboxylate transporter substrate binding protein [Proteobacteria bacterium]|nr:tripartite tricarboxylate transporter substrate binding protein [Burkholderiales bacterium]